jgi:hypothetical protein
MPHRSLCSVVWCLWLRDIDNGTRHGADEYDAAWRLPLHEMLCHSNGKKICAVHVDTPELLDAIIRITNCIIIFREAGGCDLLMSFKYP